jgi:hypothetical protein
MKSKLTLIAASAALALGVAGVASGSVNYDPATGGFVGKGDVQSPLGLNNKQMQAVHTLVTFSYDATVGYTFECEWYTGPDRNRTYHKTAGEPISVNIGGVVPSYDRKTGQLTGWKLDPVSLSGGSAPEPTDADCGAEGNEMKSIVDGSVQSFTEGGGLVAHYNGTDIPLPNTVVVTP